MPKWIKPIPSEIGGLHSGAFISRAEAFASYCGFEKGRLAGGRPFYNADFTSLDDAQGFARWLLDEGAQWVELRPMIHATTPQWTVLLVA